MTRTEFSSKCANKILRSLSNVNPDNTTIETIFKLGDNKAILLTNNGQHLMHFIRHIEHFKALQKTIVTIGAFDGLHQGHQTLLQQVAQIAKQSQWSSAVICFEPQPKEFFLGDLAPPRISLFRDKMLAFKAMPIDYVFSLKFDAKMAILSAEDFVLHYLIKLLNVAHVVIGDDFRFGKDRCGDFQLLKTMGDQYGFKVSQMSTLLNHDQRVSSSMIRQQLENGAFVNANKLIGRSYTINARVKHGAKNGRKIGFPTLNMSIPREIALKGVYIVSTEISGETYYGIANIGVRPTLCGEQRLLETHLFNFNQEIYGSHLEISFLYKIRSEKKFASFDALANQIKLDKDFAIQWLEKHIQPHQPLFNHQAQG